MKDGSGRSAGSGVGARWRSGGNGRSGRAVHGAERAAGARQDVAIVLGQIRQISQVGTSKIHS